MTGTHWATELDMDWRLKLYWENNKSDVANPNLTDFFDKYVIGFFSQHCSEIPEKVIEAFKIFIERNGKPFNYMTYDEENENWWERNKINDWRREKERSFWKRRTSWERIKNLKRSVYKLKTWENQRIRKRTAWYKIITNQTIPNGQCCPNLDRGLDRRV